MSFDHFTNQWFIVLHLDPGIEFLYKYITNNDHWVINEEEPKKKDNSGNINNFVIVTTLS